MRMGIIIVRKRKGRHISRGYVQRNWGFASEAQQTRANPSKTCREVEKELPDHALRLKRCNGEVRQEKEGKNDSQRRGIKKIVLGTGLTGKRWCEGKPPAWFGGVYLVRVRAHLVYRKNRGGK